MCDLKTRIKNLMKEYRIPEEQLTYNWNDENAEVVEQRFQNWSCRIKNCREQKEFEEIIDEIFSWGHVGSKNKKGQYAKRLLDKKVNVCEKQTTPIASWSKVLAAYDPQNYFIYDSRVAIALQMLYWDDYNWFIPEGRDILSSVLAQIQKSATQKESYNEYLNLLKKTEDAAYYEKRLFMLGKCFELDLSNIKKIVLFKSGK